MMPKQPTKEELQQRVKASLTPRTEQAGEGKVFGGRAGGGMTAASTKKPFFERERAEFFEGARSDLSERVDDLLPPKEKKP